MADVKRYKTPVFRLSFPHLFKPNTFGDSGGEGKFSCSAVWRPGDFSAKEKELWKAILKALDDTCMEKFSKHFKDLPGNYKKGLRKGDEKADLEGYGEGTVFASLSTKMRPGIVDINGNKIGPEEGNEDLIYPGCYCRATVNPYAYDNRSKGVALGLMNLQKVDDGERLDSRTDAGEDFADDIVGSEADNDEDPLA